jgi:hypothetical protein
MLQVRPDTIGTGAGFPLGQTMAFSNLPGSLAVIPQDRFIPPARGIESEGAQRRKTNVQHTGKPKAATKP